MRRTKRRERRCQQCFAYISADSRKCEFCGYKYKSSGKYLFDKIKQIFKVDKVYTLDRVKRHSTQAGFFTLEEIEYLLKMENLKIQMFLVLDDLAFLDEISLIELGEMMSSIDMDKTFVAAPINLN